MIKEILEQLAPLDAQITALKGSGDDMDAITAHAAELAELAVEEDEILRACGPLTAEDRVFLARHPDRPHIDETISALFTDFFEQRGDRQCKEDPAILGGIAGNQIDKAVNNTTGERITVRLDQKRNGTRNYTVVQVASRNNPIQVGQRVRVIIGNNGSRVLAY